MGHGVRIDQSASTNTIGGSAAGAGNVISGNDEHGVYLLDSGTANNTVEGNRIGTNVSGTAAVPNTEYGVRIEAGANNNRIGGASSGARNLISGNTQSGIIILGAGTTDNDILGNYVGTDVTGAVAIPNVASGIYVAAPATTIGGGSAGEGNIISGNLAYGIYLVTAITTNTIIQGNHIGVDSAGTGALGNGVAGIAVADAPNTTIGGGAAGEGNVVGANGTFGIFADAVGTLIQGNSVGTDVSGTLALGNLQGGVLFTGSASSGAIGGTGAGEGNVIAYNAFFGGVGVTTTAADIAILGNSIVNNTNLGIDLNLDTVTPNDAGDGDTGPNDLLNFPEITGAFELAGTISVDFDLDASRRVTSALSSSAILLAPIPRATARARSSPRRSPSPTPGLGPRASATASRARLEMSSPRP